MNRQDSRRQMDEQISIQERRTLELKTLRNTFADVSMLPRELLVEVFLLVQGLLPVKQWHQITHVCRYWRDTALSAPILWTRLPTHLHEYTNLMLERSGTAGLSIAVNNLKTVSTATIQSFVHHAGHIHALKLHLGAAQLQEVFEHFVASAETFSRLQSLHVHESLYAHDSPNVSLPSNLFPESSPVSELSLCRVSIDWQILASLNLVSLHLSNITLRAQISAATFLDTLRNMPRLQHLAFTTQFISLTSDEAAQVYLPLLQELAINDRNHAHISYFLARLELPSLKDLMLHSSGESGRATIYPPIMLTPIPKVLAGGNFHDAEKLSVEYGSIGIISSNIRVVDVSLSPGLDDSDPDIPCMQFLLRQIVPIFCDLADVYIDIPLGAADLLDAFGSLRLLRRITLSSNASLVPAFTNALKGQPGHTSDQAARPFPGLDTIYLHYIPWSEVGRDEATALCYALLQRAAQTKLVVQAKPPLPGWISKFLAGDRIEVKDLRG